MNEQEAKKLRERTTGKFTQVPAWISHGSWLKHLRPSELKVYLYLCSQADNRTRITFPATSTRQTISLRTGVSLGTVSGIIHNLEICGYVRILKEGRSNAYIIQFSPPDSWPSHGPTNAARSKAATGRRDVLKANCSSPVASQEMVDAPFVPGPLNPFTVKHSEDILGNTEEPDSSPILDF